MNKKQGDKYLQQLLEEKEFANKSRVTEGIGIPKSWCDEDRSYFCCQSGNNAMSGIGINEGDLLTFEVTDSLNSGEVGLFFTKGKKSICRIYKIYDSGSIYLVSTDSSVEPYRVDPEDKEFHIAGKLVAILKDMRNISDRE